MRKRRGSEKKTEHKLAPAARACAPEPPTTHTHTRLNRRCSPSARSCKGGGEGGEGWRGGRGERREEEISGSCRLPVGVPGRGWGAAAATSMQKYGLPSKALPLSSPLPTHPPSAQPPPPPPPARLRQSRRAHLSSSSSAVASHSNHALVCTSASVLPLSSDPGSRSFHALADSSSITSRS